MPRPISFRIAVTDVNSHIQAFIQRELTKETYSAFCLHCTSNVHDLMEHPIACDLIILDPELFQPYGPSLFNTVLKTYRQKEIILHTYKGILDTLPQQKNIVLIEKNQASILSIKNRIRTCFDNAQGRPIDRLVKNLSHSAQ